MSKIIGKVGIRYDKLYHHWETTKQLMDEFNQRYAQILEEVHSLTDGHELDQSQAEAVTENLRQQEATLNTLLEPLAYLEDEIADLLRDVFVTEEVSFVSSADELDEEEQEIQPPGREFDALDNLEDGFLVTHLRFVRSSE